MPRTYIKGKWRDIYGTKPNRYYLAGGKKVPFNVSSATKSFMKRYNKRK